MKTFKIVTWNINGIRAISNYQHKNDSVFCLNKLMGKKSKIDIICLQEVKALLEQVPLEYVQNPEWEFFLSPSYKKGQSGVATLIRKNVKLKKQYAGIGIKNYDQEGRIIVTEFENFNLLNVYFPNGRRDHSRVAFKLKFTDALFKYALELQQKTKNPSIICGDVNTAHQEIDLSNPRANQKTTGFLPEERQLMSELFNKNWMDYYRSIYPDKKNAFTWWTYRQNCRARNIGWRLDYFIGPKENARNIKKIEILSDYYGSDHCPVKMDISF